MTMYAKVENATGYVICTTGRLDPPDYTGELDPPPEAQEGFTLYHVTEAMPWASRPSSTSTLSWNNGVPEWVETASLEEVKATKNEEINAARLKANRTTFPFGGKLVACDELSRSDIDGVNGKVTLTGSLPTNWGGAWKATDNTYIPIPDVTTWTAFYTAMVDQGESNFNHSQTLKSQLASATTVEEVRGITW